MPKFPLHDDPANYLRVRIATLKIGSIFRYFYKYKKNTNYIDWHKYPATKNDGISTKLWKKKFKNGFPGNWATYKIKMKYPVEQQILRTKILIIRYLAKLLLIPIPTRHHQHGVSCKSPARKERCHSVNIFLCPWRKSILQIISVDFNCLSVYIGNTLQKLSTSCPFRICCQPSRRFDHVVWKA